MKKFIVEIDFDSLPEKRGRWETTARHIGNALSGVVRACEAGDYYATNGPFDVLYQGQPVGRIRIEEA